MMLEAYLQALAFRGLHGHGRRGHHARHGHRGRHHHDRHGHRGRQHHARHHQTVFWYLR